MNNKKILIICGHPDHNSYTGAVLDTYEESAIKAGHEVVRCNLGELHFDPILHHGYKEVQPLEPDLETVQRAIIECDHLVIGYPNWWCTMPAILKGLFDRIWLPGFAFNFDHENMKIVRLLGGRTARVYVLSGTNSPLKNWWQYGDFTNEIEYGILGFAGFKTKLTVFGPTEHTSDNQREQWLKKVAKDGEAGV